MKRLRILLVDDHEVVRLGLQALLSAYPEFQVVGEARDADEAVARAMQYRPDIILMDVRMPGRSGIEATRDIARTMPEIKVILLTSFAEDDLLVEAMEAGASGYVLKQIGADGLVDALEKISRGEELLDPTVTQRLFSRVRTAERGVEGSSFGELTEQELRVLALITEGCTNKEIAQQLHLSSGTVRNYVSTLIHKLEVSNRAEAAAFAMHHHIQNYLPRGA